ncbi:serrate RNA effector molecule homolog isoform X4 [Narcine bancroftii]|uniref:serrate RNA effector molecule homolog isoform X4 n=1 Tax=Narcine bancroftii TaxID=1343680 RepID=UPI003831AFDF
MGDSDDEYDRRRRDKFRRERSDYDRSRERDDRRRDDWNDREWDRGRERRSREYRDYDRGRRERFSPPRHDLSPPQKRVRREWLGNLHELEVGPPPPVMKTFKEFLLSLDDSVDETESVKRYNDYKIEFRRQQMQDFFLAHKDEEWFRSKYHPDEAGKRKQEADFGLRTRLSVYCYLMEHGWFDGLSLDIDKANIIMKALDAAVIKMEGGTQIDVKILDLEDEEEKNDKMEPVKKEEGKILDNDRKVLEKEKEEDTKKAEGGEQSVEVKVQQDKDDSKSKEVPDEEKGEDGEEKDEAGPCEPAKESSVPVKAAKKRKRKHSGDDSYDEDDVTASDSESEPEIVPPGVEKKEDENPGKQKEDNEKTQKEEEPKQEKKEEEKHKEKLKEEKKDKEVDVIPKPRPLHKTCSLFMRSIAPNISKAEIISLCKRFPGFMRVALSEPQPERRFFRRAWVTFDRSVNIKEICWNLQNIRLRDCELSPVVNRDLARRVRSINGITQHKQIVRNDIKLAAKLIHSLDDRSQLWSSETVNEDGRVESLSSQNPILKNITDYLIEEVSAEEEELLGNPTDTVDDGPKEGNPEVNIERDEKLIKVLDKLLLYLRIVHSIDYYNTCEYPNEDEMPNRCGIVHVRGPLPPNRVSQHEVVEWQKLFEEKLTPLFSVRESLSEEEAAKMGKKDSEQEVEKFIVANTQELAKDKWLCPLSGKKFKGPEFVRKHIFNKHSEKIEEVKKEVSFFNHFLMDAKRPALPEIKPNQPPAPGAQAMGLTPAMGYPHPTPQGLLGFGQPRPPVMGYGAGPAYPPPQYAGRGSYDAYRGQGGYPGKPRNRILRGDPRNVVEYRDLDAPEDVDFF